MQLAYHAMSHRTGHTQITENEHEQIVEAAVAAGARAASTCRCDCRTSRAPFGHGDENFSEVAAAKACDIRSIRAVATTPQFLASRQARGRSAPPASRKPPTVSDAAGAVRAAHRLFRPPEGRKCGSSNRYGQCEDPAVRLQTRTQTCDLHFDRRHPDASPCKVARTTPTIRR